MIRETGREWVERTEAAGCSEEGCFPAVGRAGSALGKTDQTVSAHSKH